MLDDLTREGALVFRRYGDSIVSSRERHGAGPDNRVGQMLEMVPHVIIEVQINVGREGSACRVNRVCDAGRRRHDGVVSTTLVFLVDLIEAMRDLMGAAAQKGARNVLLLLTGGSAEKRALGGRIAILTEAGYALAGNTDSVEHYTPSTSQMRLH